MHSLSHLVLAYPGFVQVDQMNGEHFFHCNKGYNKLGTASLIRAYVIQASNVIIQSV